MGEIAAKKEKEEKENALRKEKEALKKEKDEAIRKKRGNNIKDKVEKNEKEAKNLKELSDKTEQKNNENIVKKKISSTKSLGRDSQRGKKQDISNETSPATVSTRKIMPSKPLISKSPQPSSKLKKDENNKKVMETRKASVANKSYKAVGEEKSKPKKPTIASKKIQNKTDFLEEETKVDEKI